MIIVNATGRLIKDAELKYIPNTGTAVLNFALASSRIYTKEDTDSDIITCQVWGKRAESLAAVLTKGYLVQLVGELQSNKDKVGQYWWVVNVKELQLLSKPRQEPVVNKPQNDFQFIEDFPAINDTDLPF